MLTRTLVLLLLAALQGCRSGPPPVDVEAIMLADRAYADAWLEGDADSVMGTLTTEPVVVPSGMEALDGVDAIRAFWFPLDGAPTNVTRFELQQDEVRVDGGLAFVRGSFELAFEYSGEDYASSGTYLSILERDAAGAWRIARRTWNDH